MGNRNEQNGEIANSEYQELNSVSKPTATRELSFLVERGIIVRHGRTGRGTIYKLKGSNGSETAQTGYKQLGSNAAGRAAAEAMTGEQTRKPLKYEKHFFA